MINQGKISYSSSKPNDVVNDFVKGVGSLTYDASLIKIGAVNFDYDKYHDQTDIRLFFTPVVFTERALKVLIHTVALLNVQLYNYCGVGVFADLDYALEELNRREQSSDTPLEDAWSYEELTTPEEQETGINITQFNMWLGYDKDEDCLFFPDGNPVLYDHKGVVAGNRSRFDNTRYRIDTLECVVNYLIEKEYTRLKNNG